MNAMVPGLSGGKMSSSDPNTKIDFLDSPEAVRKKIKLAFCEEGNTTENGVLAFIESVLIPITQMRLEREKGQTQASAVEGQDSSESQKSAVPPGTVFTIDRDEKWGGPTHYSAFADLKTDFAAKNVHPGDLKTAVAKGINGLLDPIRKSFAENEDWQRIAALAYPDPNAKPEKKKKKVSLERL
jgi:tyrosyl-tRNA synthetase